MKGGSCNRIFGIQTPFSDRFILRIPRYDFSQQKCEMTILRYVKQHTSIPTAQIIFYDSTPKNPLNEPYVIHTRTGQDLHANYLTLSHEQKLTIAEQWGQILLSQLTVRNDFAGIVATIADDDNTQIYVFHPFDVNLEPDSEKTDTRLLSKQSILDIFILQFDRWIAADKRVFPVSTPQSRLFKSLSHVPATTKAWAVQSVLTHRSGSGKANFGISLERTSTGSSRSTHRRCQGNGRCRLV